ncbi:TetR/AcrR family transcriptional regulator [Microbacterium ginsengiterrae]|nr:TetR/AcrR family transcriptional regulator [Microbacterium ginsengiterrae]
MPASSARAIIPSPETAPRRKRADALRNTETILEAAKAVFAESGVDAPMRDIAARAGVGVGTVYRNYAVRSDLIIAVFRSEVDATAAEGRRIAEDNEPADALRLWAARFARFIATKRGLADALHSGDPAYQTLPAYFLGTLAPQLQSILDAGARAGTIRDDVRAEDVLHALSRLADGAEVGPGNGAGRMADVFLDGLILTTTT